MEAVELYREESESWRSTVPLARQQGRRYDDF